MRSFVSVLLVFCSVYPLQAGRTIRISSPQFSFLIDEPEGWMVDVRSAVQIANFVVHRQGTTWRYADVVVFGRFVPRQPDERLEDFIKDDELRFQQGCPLSDIQPLEMEFSQPRAHEFLVKSYKCVSRSEVVAIAQVPFFFVMISMATEKGEAALRDAMGAFKEIVETFRYLPGQGRQRPVPSGNNP